MRTTLKLSLFLWLPITILFSTIAAASSFYTIPPLITVVNRLPDIAVTDIHQESQFMYMRVCNNGWSLGDSVTSIVLGMKSVGGIVSRTDSIVLGTNECQEFRVASVEELGITTSGVYNITAWALLKDGIMERITDNNKITKAVQISCPTRVQPTPIYYFPNYNSTTPSSNNNNFNNNISWNNDLCSPANNYCSNSRNNSNSNNYNNSNFNNNNNNPNFNNNWSQNFNNNNNGSWNNDLCSPANNYCSNSRNNSNNNYNNPNFNNNNNNNFNNNYNNNTSSNNNYCNSNYCPYNTSSTQYNNCPFGGYACNNWLNLVE